MRGREKLRRHWAYLFVVTIVVGNANRMQAEIYQWEYVDAADPSQGKRESANLAPDGAGVDAVSGADLSFLDLTMAFISDADLQGTRFIYSDLSNADLARARLSNASLDGAMLMGANLAESEIRGAILTNITPSGFTADQLYSTASYQSHQLVAVKFGDGPGTTNNFTGWNFVAQDVSGGSFSGVNLTNADLRQTRLVGTNLESATLTGALFDDADVRQARFSASLGSGLTLPQLYSTASYKTKDLSGIVISGDLSGADLADVNLSDADFRGTVLTASEFRKASLRRANFSNAALSDVQLDDADVQSANFSNTTAKGLSPDQLYSTASYEGHDLTGVNLGSNNLSGWNFASQNLADASFSRSTLTGAGFSDAEIVGTNFSGSNLSYAQLTSTASYLRRDLRNVNLSHRAPFTVVTNGPELSNAQLGGQNLEGANFDAADLTGAYFDDAIIRGANLSGIRDSPSNQRGISLPQLYSTASYRSGDLTGVVLSENNLNNADFRDKNLAGADFTDAVVTGAMFAGSNIRGARFGGTYVDSRELTSAQLYSTASYQDKELSGIQLFAMDLYGWNFAGCDLTDADFSRSAIAPWEALRLPGADFTNAVIRGVRFNYDGSSLHLITQEQVYSTTSYQVGDLREIEFIGGNGDERFDSSRPYRLSHFNFSDVDLDGAIFDNVDFLDIDFSHSQLRNARLEAALFSIPQVDFTGADLRGVYNTDELYLRFFDANWTNAIRPDGRVTRLNLTGSEYLNVHDYDGDPTRALGPIDPMAVVVESSLTMNATGLLRLVFDVDPWNSTISFQSGIPVILGGGTLELTFAEGVDVASQLGRTIDLFDWTGVSPTGDFVVRSLYKWDYSKLYTTGEVTLLAVPEPTTAALLLASLVLGVAWQQRRRRCFRMEPRFLGTGLLVRGMLVIGLEVSATSASAVSYVATMLHPEGAFYSEAVDVSGDTQIGNVYWGSGSTRAVTWNGTAQSIVELDNNAVAKAVFGNNQVGYKFPPGGSSPHAALWSGTRQSHVDLHPGIGFIASAAADVWGASQIGNGRGQATGGDDHALLWHGTAASMVDLHPTGFSDSYGHGIYGDTQVGAGFASNEYHALLWHGTAESVGDLHPTGFDSSYAYGVFEESQVGYAQGTLTEGQKHASLWSGTAASYVDLHPTGFFESIAYNLSAAGQVGYGYDEFGRRAMYWNGTADSAVDLHSLLVDITPTMVESEALAISDNGSIVGNGYDEAGTSYAIFWTRATVAGDYSENGVVDAADYVVWRDGINPLANEVATPGENTPEDYTEWGLRFGNTSGSAAGVSAGSSLAPEAATSALLAVGLLTMAGLPPRRRGLD